MFKSSSKISWNVVSNSSSLKYLKLIEVSLLRRSDDVAFGFVVTYLNIALVRVLRIIQFSQNEFVWLLSKADFWNMIDISKVKTYRVCIHSQILPNLNKPNGIRTLFSSSNTSSDANSLEPLSGIASSLFRNGKACKYMVINISLTGNETFFSFLSFEDCKEFSLLFSEWLRSRHSLSERPARPNSECTMISCNSLLGIES